MAVAQNLIYRQYKASLNYYNPAQGQFFGNLYPLNSVARMTVNEEQAESNAPVEVQQLALLHQIWAKLILSEEAQIIDSTGFIDGSGWQTVSDKIGAVEWFLFEIPQTADVMPGNPESYPHIGEAAIVYTSPVGQHAYGEKLYLTKNRHMFFPQGGVPQGVYWRLNPGWSGMFVFYDDPARRMKTLYQWGGTDVLECNPAKNLPPIPEPL